MSMGDEVGYGAGIAPHPNGEREKTSAIFNIYIFQYLFISYVGNDSNLLIVFYVQIMPDDFVMQLHRF